jgi:capsular polysaccharide biosynthesis protein
LSYELRIFYSIDNALIFNQAEILHDSQAYYGFSTPLFYCTKNGETNNNLDKISKNIMVLSIKNTVIIGGSSIMLFEPGKAIYELMYYTNGKQKYKYSDEGIIAYRGNLALLSVSKIKNKFDIGINLVNNFSWNYYHLMFESIAKFYYINQLDLIRSTPVFIDEIVFTIPQYKELLDYINIFNHPLIPISRDERYLVHNLINLPLTLISSPDYNRLMDVLPEDTLYNIDSVLHLRNQLLFKKSNKMFPKRILIARKSRKGRREYNEDEIYQYLDNYGFDLIYPEVYSLSDQIALFNNAEFIVGTTGAAFTNLLFCSNQCKILCFTNFNLKFSYFSTIASIIRMEMVYLNDNSKRVSDKSYIHESFNVNINQLSAFIENTWKLKLNSNLNS